MSVAEQVDFVEIGPRRWAITALVDDRQRTIAVVRGDEQQALDAAIRWESYIAKFGEDWSK